MVPAGPSAATAITGCIMDRMRTGALGAFLFLAGIVAAEGSDERWTMLSDGARTSTLLDRTGTGRTPDGTVFCRLKRLFTVEDEHSYAMDSLELDCRRNQYRYRAILIYDRDDLLMHRYRLTDQFAPIPAGSDLEKARNLICPASTS